MIKLSKLYKLNIIIIIYGIISCVTLYLLELILSSSYLFLVIQKIIFFGLIPIILSYFLKQKVSKIGKIQKNSFIYGLSFGILGGIIVFFAYLFLKDYIDWNSIKDYLTNKQINKTTFLLVFSYVTFGNSFLEEYFFRGFIFYNLEKRYKKFAYIFNSLLFSLYHITIFGTWFSGWVILIALFGLFLGGLFFSWLYKKTFGIWGAWIFHIIIDLVIVFIGYTTFFI